MLPDISCMGDCVSIAYFQIRGIRNTLNVCKMFRIVERDILWVFKPIMLNDEAA